MTTTMINVMTHRHVWHYSKLDFLTTIIPTMTPVTITAWNSLCTEGLGWTVIFTKLYAKVFHSVTCIYYSVVTLITTFFWKLFIVNKTKGQLKVFQCSETVQ